MKHVKIQFFNGTRKIFSFLMEHVQKFGRIDQIFQAESEIDIDESVSKITKIE